MAMALDLRVTELLCSRLCHDLVSPVGALANGVELVVELGGEMDDEVVRMIGDSADLASARLRFFRSAYGLTGGGDAESDKDLKALAETRAGSEGYRLDWVVEAGQISAQGKPGKLALNLLLLAEEALLRGGAIGLRSGPGLEAKIEDEGGAFSDDLAAAFRHDTPVESLTARTVHAYYTAQLAAECGLGLSVEAEAEGRVVIRVK